MLQVPLHSSLDADIGTIGMTSPEEKLMYGRDGLSKINMDLLVWRCGMKEYKT